MICSGGLGAATWTELDDRQVTLVVPVGSVEQHGPHLPLDTDTRIAGAVADGARAALGSDDTQMLIAPALAYGASGEHEDFPGTISIGHEALRQVLVEYGRSACRWAARIVFVNGHGGNVATLIDAVGLLRVEGRDAAWFPCAVAGADAHAGATETSLLLHISPESVRPDAVAVGNTGAVADLMPALRSSGVRAVSPNGVLGDPRSGHLDDGRAHLDAMATRLADAVRRWSPDEHGVLR
ncbi:mycofactocin system creatininase [Williamsia sp. Leaf354]|jgi:creatinine amidohydrolase|uniref:mycofactocin biosynthesis peptidyl-dipeptidase MftE n=1 Tax=Williamsia sp. Leaf354 TaxID=1736349 RepID=UPI00070174E7|nr:mycofactocin biosynthesis peptidyl-dipeptidase MftE [Williamsia sp. Leaf354]KQR96092.1 mycofactocin system creatininase [Williamsia sp. Leaf354]